MTTISTAARPRGPSADVLQPVWRVLTSVRMAVALISALALCGLLGVLIPQVPEAMRGNDAAVSAWVDAQRDTFGPFTDVMRRLGLFQVFQARWFLFGLGYLVVNVSVCTFNRWSPTFRNTFKPPRRVPDTFFERAHNRITLPPIDPAAAEAALRRLRFRVEAREEGGTTYLFGDRYPWAQLATFLSHLALVLFIAGGLVTSITSFSTEILAGEGTTSPVFAVSDPDQLQVRIDDAVGRFGERGNPLDYRTKLTIFHNGEEVKSGFVTVNDPLKYGGYRFHQVAFAPEGAALRIRDAANGNTLFHETFLLDQTTAAAEVTIMDGSGTTLLHDVIAPTDFLPVASGALVSVPSSDRVLWLGLTARDDESWELVAFDPRSGEASAARAGEGATADLRGLRVRFDRVTAIPSAIGLGVPGSEGGVLTQLTASPEGAPVLMLIAEDRPAVSLAEGEPLTLDGLQYTFEGRREFSGIAVRRDRGAWFIWAATAMLVGGLALTFYVPRRRMWLKLTGGATHVAALAEKRGGFEKDMRILASRLHVPPPPELEEES